MQAPPITVHIHQHFLIESTDNFESINTKIRNLQDEKTFGMAATQQWKYLVTYSCGGKVLNIEFTS